MVLERKNVLTQITNIFIEVLDNKDINLSELSTSDDVEGWDSLTHLHLVVAMEKQFEIRFNSKEIRTWKTIGDIIDSILSK